MKDFLDQKIILYAGIALIIIGVAGLVRGDTNDVETTDQANQSSMVQIYDVEVTSSDEGRTISYQGVEGETALDLLKRGADVVVEDSNLGEFVVAINGISQTDSEYWLYYIDDEPASVGAFDYVSEGGETIEWRLEN